MQSCPRSILFMAAALPLLFLIGCGGGTSTPTETPTPKNFQLTITGAAAGTGTVTSTPAGVSCPSTCTATFAQNTQVTLIETPAAGYTFAGWSGACSGTGACVMTITAAATITASFTQSATSQQLTVTVTGSGTVSSSPAGISCPSTCSASYAQNTQVTLTETPAAGSTFTGWAGACGGTAACTVPMSAATAVTATFAQTSTPQIVVTVSGSGTVTSSPAGINCPSTCSAPFAQNAVVTLTETPAPGSTFTGWGGACATAATTCTVTVAAATGVSATFSQPPTQLTVSVSGPGTVASSPPGISCPGTCSANFPQGAAVTLTGTASSGYGLGSWAGSCTGSTNPCIVTLSSPGSVTGTFSPLGTVAVTLKGVGTGTVTSSPAGINCPGTCSASFANNTQVTLTASGDAKSAFAGWTGACSGTGPCVVTVTDSTSAAVTSAFGVTLQSGINHIIFLAQENRSLDHYFGALPQYWADDGYVHYKNQAFNGLPQFPTNAPSGAAPTNPGCNPADPFTPPTTLNGPYQDCVYDQANPIGSYHLQTMCVENPSPSWNESHADMNFNDPTLHYTGLATLDGFIWTAAHDSRYPIADPFDNTKIVPQFMDTNGVRVMGYYDGDDLNYYYYMASNFATSDSWFSPVMSRTNPNREYLIGGTSYGFAYPNGTDTADNMQIPSPIIFQELQNAGISWKVYIHTDPLAHDYDINPPNPPLHCGKGSTDSNGNVDPKCLYQISYLHNFTYGQTIINQYPQNIVSTDQFIADAKAGTLPQVAQIEPASNAGLDEHAADNDPTPNDTTPCCSVQAGAAYVETLIEAVMGTNGNPSPSWKDSVFVLTYDEYGGFYDHVAPQTGPQFPAPDSFVSPVDLYQGPPPVGAQGPDVCVKLGGPTCQFQYSGYRVPLIVISPFTKQNYVSHAPADYTAILKLIETRFNVPALTKRDDAQIDMSQEFFDLVNEPWKTPPAIGPNYQNTSGPCYLDHLP